MTFQYGGYLRFKLVYLENKFGDPYFLFYTISYITINYVTNFEKILSGHKKVILKNHVYNFFENSLRQNFFKICHIVHCTARKVFLK